MLPSVEEEAFAYTSCAALPHAYQRLFAAGSSSPSTQVMEEEKGAMAQNLQVQAP